MFVLSALKGFYDTLSDYFHLVSGLKDSNIIKTDELT